MNGFAFVANFQGFAVVAFALTLVAWHVHIRQEVHFHFDYAIALTGFATPAAYVKTETPRVVTACTGFRYAGEQLTNRGEHARVGCRVRARCTANRALVNIDDFVEEF